MTEYKSGNNKPIFSFSKKDTDSMRLSVAPSLDEKINFLIQNFSQEDEPKKDKAIVEIEDTQAAAAKQLIPYISSFSKIPTSSPIGKNLTTSASCSRASTMGPSGSSRAHIFVKREDTQETLIMDKLRKKVCRKIFTILKDEHNMPISDAKEATLNLEERVNMLFPTYSSAKHYIEIIKTLFRKVKVCLSFT